MKLLRKRKFIKGAFQPNMPSSFNHHSGAVLAGLDARYGSWGGVKTIIHLPGLPGALMHELKIRLCLMATGVYIYICTEAMASVLFIEVGTHETPG